MRLSYSWDATRNRIEILDRNDYYPFGMNFVAAGAGAMYDPKGSPLNYKFGTKELQETGFYDFGARMLMPDIGRWFTIDPLAEKNRKLTPYHYAANNPIRNIDPDGRMELNFTGEAAKEAFVQLRDAQTERSQKNAQRPPDGHFNANGRYMYTDKKKSNNVIVHSGNGKYLLSQLDYGSRGTRKAVSNILAYYAASKGVKGYVGVGTYATGTANTNGNGNIFFNSTSLKSGLFNNAYNIRSTINHEIGHKNENIPDNLYTFVDHSKVYLQEAMNPDFAKTTEGYRAGQAASFGLHVLNAANKESSYGTNHLNMINTYNNKNSGDVYINTYNPGGLPTGITITPQIGDTYYNTQAYEDISKPQD